MKQRFYILSCLVLILSVLTGCQESADTNNATEMVIKDDQQFPKFVSGRWKGDKWGWEIVFGPENTLSSAVIPLGQVKIRPYQATEVQGRGGQPGIFEAGDCEVNYDPQSHEVSVSIEMKRVYMDMGSIIDGSCAYFLIGDFSEDGKIWYANVFTKLDLNVLTPDPNSSKDKPVFEKTGHFWQDFSDESPEEVIFTKTDNSIGNQSTR